MASLVVFAAGCEVRQEEAGEAPDIDVQVDPGKLPEYEVEGPEVEVGTEEQEVIVPNVEVTQEKETITTPTLDVELPSEDKE
ncbi:MAG: hypothetical protein HC886_00710 [Leptolyngbyaceae cyanobacterium SM1_1_3]|nr:hypothetical protein [Leptolyngbyaceae cyanobacterium SM1_1_3]NJN02890.1 hypothetical protein [Leptolyngbyaceae cyanobacterium RM1_1_2]NJO11569.1 hypothetical protein [Leptolyngbyaceae cyanobacterium SL_1_1]